MIDWSGFGLPKDGDTPRLRRARRRRAAMRAAAEDRDLLVMNRHGGQCVAYGISPVCTRWAVDPHELIPVGIGGPRESWNRVPICRACHRAAQGCVGGNRLRFWWPGKEDGARPKADEPGHVKCYWAEGKNPDEYPNPFTSKVSSTQSRHHQAAAVQAAAVPGPGNGVLPFCGPIGLHQAGSS